MGARKIYSRIWHPRQKDVDLWKYSSYLLPALALPLGLLIIPMALFFLDKVAMGLIYFLFFTYLTLRGIVYVRGAYTLPLDDKWDFGIAVTSKQYRSAGVWVIGVFLVISIGGFLLLRLFSFSKGFIVIPITMAVLSPMVLGWLGLSTRACLIISVLLMVISMIISIFQAGSTGASGAILIYLFVFPMSFADAVKRNRAVAREPDESKRDQGANELTGR